MQVWLYIKIDRVLNLHDMGVLAKNKTMDPYSIGISYKKASRQRDKIY